MIPFAAALTLLALASPGPRALSECLYEGEPVSQFYLCDYDAFDEFDARIGGRTYEFTQQGDYPCVWTTGGLGAHLTTVPTSTSDLHVTFERNQHRCYFSFYDGTCNVSSRPGNCTKAELGKAKQVCLGFLKECQ